MKIKKVLLTFILMLFVLTIRAQHNLWVGQSFKCDATSAVMGLTSDVSWSVNGGYISLSGSGFYRNATVTQYYSGGATVTCSWKYRLYSGDRWRNQSKSWTITCQDNPVSISPTSLTLGVGETEAYHILISLAIVILLLQMLISVAPIQELLQFQILEL